MSKIKLLGRETKQQLIDKAKNASTYAFKSSKDDSLIDEQTLIDKNSLTKLNGKIKQSSPDDLEWDSIVVELGDDLAYAEQAAPVIVASYDTPNFTWEKDPGGGRAIQKIAVAGERPVFYDLHHDETGAHLHLKVFRWAFDEAKGTTASAPNEVPKVADAQLNYTNKLLTESGLAPIGGVDKAFSNSNKPTEETKREVSDIVNNRIDVDKLISDITTSEDFDEQTIDRALDNDAKELQTLLQAIKVKQAEINNKKQAKDIFADNRKLQFAIGEKDKTIAKLNENVETAITAFKLKDEELNEAVEKIDFLQVQVAGYSDVIRTNAEQIKELTQERDNFSDEVDDVNVELDNTKAQLLGATRTINSLNDTIESQKQTIEAEKAQLVETRNVNSQLAQRLKELDNELVTSRNATLEAQIALQAEQDKAKELKNEFDEQAKEIVEIKSIVEYIAQQLNKASSFIKTISSKMKADSPQKEQAKEIIAGIEPVVKAASHIDAEDAKQKLRDLFAKARQKIDVDIEPETPKNNKPKM